MNLISEDYLMHHGVKGMKWGVRHDPEPSGRRASNTQFREEVKNAKRDNRNAIRTANQTSRNRRKAAAQKNLQDFKNNYRSRNARKQSNKEYREEVKSAKADNRNAIRTANRESRDRIKAAGKKNLQEFRDIYERSAKSARSNFAKGVGETYRVNEFVEKKKEKAWSKANSKVGNKPIIGKITANKQNTAKENAKFYEKTRTDLTGGKVAPAKTKYQKFIRATFFKNPVGKAWTINSIKDSKYLKTGQQKATALAEMGLLSNYYKEQKKNKKEGKTYHKY